MLARAILDPSFRPTSSGGSPLTSRPAPVLGHPGPHSQHCEDPGPLTSGRAPAQHPRPPVTCTRTWPFPPLGQYQVQGPQAHCQLLRNPAQLRSRLGAWDPWPAAPGSGLPTGSPAAITRGRTWWPGRLEAALSARAGTVHQPHHSSRAYATHTEPLRAHSCM